MPRLTIAGSTYNYPDPGTEPGWGEDATDWAQAVTDVLNTLVNTGDILQTTFTLQDNQSSPASVSGLMFDPTIVRAANVTYSINRNGFNQAGTLLLNYNASAGAGSKWNFTEANKIGDVGVTFSILDTGQVQYISTSTGFSCSMDFNARTLSQ